MGVSSKSAGLPPVRKATLAARGGAVITSLSADAALAPAPASTSMLSSSSSLTSISASSLSASAGWAFASLPTEHDTPSSSWLSSTKGVSAGTWLDLASSRISRSGDSDSLDAIAPVEFCETLGTRAGDADVGGDVLLSRTRFKRFPCRAPRGGASVASGLCIPSAFDLLGLRGAFRTRCKRVAALAVGEATAGVPFTSSAVGWLKFPLPGGEALGDSPTRCLFGGEGSECSVSIASVPESDSESDTSMSRFTDPSGTTAAAAPGSLPERGLPLFGCFPLRGLLRDCPAGAPLDNATLAAALPRRRTPSRLGGLISFAAEALPDAPGTANSIDSSIAR
mmetsp:Transcript_13822/g.35517  ORF Transcript_13822/g.35517 Transcript_13822/m.35517 type:complete len:338 (-) Transcript_13822:871-1884(-)